MMPTATSFTHPPHLPQLRGLLERFESPHHRERRPTISTGSMAVDRLLPGRGLRGGTLLEWLADGQGSGASVLPIVALRQLQQTGGAVIVIDRQGHFYPPAASAWGIDLEQTIVIRPTTEADELWAIDQAMRTADVAAVLAWPTKLDSFTFRRLQLAAESSGAVGLLVRPPRAQHEPTWAAARLLVSPLPSLPMEADELSAARWRLGVTVLKSRGSITGKQVQLEVDHQTGAVYEAARYYDSATSETRAGRVATQLARAAAREQTA